MDWADLILGDPIVDLQTQQFVPLAGDLFEPNPDRWCNASDEVSPVCIAASSHPGLFEEVL